MYIEEKYGINITFVFFLYICSNDPFKYYNLERKLLVRIWNSRIHSNLPNSLKAELYNMLCINCSVYINMRYHC